MPRKLLLLNFRDLNNTELNCILRMWSVLSIKIAFIVFAIHFLLFFLPSFILAARHHRQITHTIFSLVFSSRLPMLLFSLRNSVSKWFLYEFFSIHRQKSNKFQLMPCKREIKWNCINGEKETPNLWKTPCQTQLINDKFRSNLNKLKVH